LFQAKSPHRRALLWALVPVALLSYVVFLLYDAGLFKHISEVRFGVCLPQKVFGPEDLLLVPGINLVIVSSDPRNDIDQGGLYRYDLDSRTLNILTDQKNLGFDFHPHGIDFLKNGNDIFIYAINHRSPILTTVEIFKWQPTNHELSFEKTLKSPLLQSANDLSLFAPESFFITSDFGTTNPLQKKFEQYTYSASGYLSFFKLGTEPLKLKERLFFANGVALSPDHSRLAVAAMLEKRIHIYRLPWRLPWQLPPPLHEGDERLTPENTSQAHNIELSGAPDNITIDPSGTRMLVAVHPNLLALKSMSENRRSRAPSKIIEIENWQQSSFTQKVIYENKGDEIAAASVALEIDPSRILIGSVFDDHILDCRR